MKLLEKHFPCITYKNLEFRGEVLYTEWIQWVIGWAKIIQPALEMDITTLRWSWGRSTVGYFDYETSYCTAALFVSHGVKIHIFGETDLQYDREGNNYISLTISKLAENSIIKAQILLSNPTVTSLYFMTSEDKMAEILYKLEASC